jgi:hypothetical protein
LASVAADYANLGKISYADFDEALQRVGYVQQNVATKQLLFKALDVQGTGSIDK